MSGREGRERSRGIPGFLYDAFFLLFPWGVLGFFAQPTLSMGWALADPLNVLLLAKEFSPADYFLDPHVYRLLSSSNLTPWTLLSHAGDIWLWGLFQDSISLPRIVRVHELAAAGLLVNVTYLFARLRLSRVLAGVVVVVFTFCWPLVDAAVAVPSRHYVEGAIFAVLSLFFYWKAVGEGEVASRGGLLLSAFFYLLSVTAKEVFVPLPVFLFLVDRRGFRERLRGLAGHIAVALGYVVWRARMLENLVGGYQTGRQGFDVLGFAEDAISVLVALPGALFAGAFAGAVFLVVLGVLLLRALNRGQWSFRDFAAFVLCLGVPVLPVISLVEAFGLQYTGRYFLVIAWAFAVLFGFSLATAQNRWVRAVAAVAVGVAVGFSVPATLKVLEERLGFLRHRSLRCGDFLLERGPETVFFVRAGPFAAAYVTLLARFKEVFEGEGAPFVVDDPWLLPEGFQDMKVFEMRARSESCYARSPELMRELVRERNAMRVDPGWRPDVAWQQDGIRFRVPAGGRTGTSVLVIGAQRGLRLSAPPGVDQVSGLQKAIWSHGVTAPARLRLVRPVSQGVVRVSRAVDVPPGYWDFSHP